MVNYAPGMRTIIRDEEWMIKNDIWNKVLDILKKDVEYRTHSEKVN